jgi:hypothetical protein
LDSPIGVFLLAVSRTGAGSSYDGRGGLPSALSLQLLQIVYARSDGFQLKRAMNPAAETPDSYITRVVGSRTPAYGLELLHVAGLEPPIFQWANGHQYELQLSGSRAKGTAITGSTDLDVFISLNPSVRTCNTLENVYNTLRNRLTTDGYSVREQNVSLGIDHMGLKVDVVPGVLHEGYTSDHSLYRRKAQTWTKTNIQTHITHVVGSGRVFDIRAIKIWRQLWNLDFPSFYLEMAVIEALHGRAFSDPAGNFWAVLTHLSADFPTRSVTDPANTNNCVSDDLTAAEKAAIAAAASASLKQTAWNQIIW